MDQIKSFFSQKKLDKKFKKAGTGHTLANRLVTGSLVSNLIAPVLVIGVQPHDF